MFADRTEAGSRLAEQLAPLGPWLDAVVLGIPRGGVVVAAEVARVLALPLDIVATAKVSAPGSPEFAIGAVSADGEVYPNPASGFSADEVEGERRRRAGEGGAHARPVRRGREPARIEGRARTASSTTAWRPG